MPIGTIIKALSGYYYVMPDGEGPDGIVQCRARGVFKKKGISPLVGDRVEFRRTEHGEGTVDAVLPRKSELIRPPVANVDTAVLVFSITNPDLNYHLLDKFLVHTEHAGLDNIICLSKADLSADTQKANECVERYERIGYRVIVTSAMGHIGTDQLFEELTGKLSVFAGQSGVGKSSLLNSLVPEARLATGEVSVKLGRGRHTTRHVEFVPLPNGGAVADTPGFSQLDFSGIELEQLSDCFKEFRNPSAQCKFRGCLHMNEPSCKVREAVRQGEIAVERYEHYQQFAEEIRNKKRRY